MSVTETTEIKIKLRTGKDRVLPLSPKLRSIFDRSIAGQIATDGNYYNILIDHKTHKPYTVTREVILETYKQGRPLKPNETATFLGEEVRGMTDIEEYLWNEDKLMEHVDLWGNIAVSEPFDVEYFMENYI